MAVRLKSASANDVALAEVVTFRGADARANTVRLGIMICADGVPFAVLELWSSIIDMAEGQEHE